MSAAREHVAADLARYEEQLERHDSADERVRTEALAEFEADPLGALDIVVDDEARSVNDSVSRMRHEAMDALYDLLDAHRTVAANERSATDKALAAVLDGWCGRYLAVRVAQEANR